MKAYSFTRREHLKKNSSIKHVFDKGIPVKSKSFNIYLLEKDIEPHIKRVAIIIRKHLYNKKIFLRNRYRRILREAYRKTRQFLPGSYEIVILGKKLHRNTKSTEVERELRDVFKKFAKSL